VPLHIGTSGWQYGHWRERYYPRGLPQRSWLEHYAAHFATVEVNNAFYRLPSPETFESWSRRTPEDFIVAVKSSRYLSHIKRLREPAEPVERFMANASHLGAKLGPVLLQLPPNFKAAPELLDETLERFATGQPQARVAVELRHESWFTAGIRAVLERHGVALCLADRGSAPVSPLWRTAEWGYLRFHWGRAARRSCYGTRALRSWAGRLSQLFSAGDDVYAYFNNDPGGCALRDATLFARAAHSEGLTPTRVPPRGALKDLS